VSAATETEDALLTAAADRLFNARGETRTEASLQTVLLALRVVMHVLTLQELTATNPPLAQRGLRGMWLKAEEAASSREDFTGAQEVAIAVLHEYFAHAGDWVTMLACCEAMNGREFGSAAFAAAVTAAARDVSRAVIIKLRERSVSAGGAHGR